MVLRLYFSNAAAGFTPTTFRGGWEQTTGTVVCKLGPKSGALTNVAVSETSTSATFDVALGRFVSDPFVRGGTLSTDTIRLVYGHGSTTGLDQFSSVIAVWVTVGDSDTRRGGWTLNGANRVSASTWATTDISQRWTAFAPGANGDATIAAAGGDRLVFELGARAVNTTSSTRTAKLYYGGTGTDLPDASGGTVTTDPGWVDLTGSVIENLWTPVSGTAALDLGALSATVAAFPTTPGTAAVTFGALSVTALGTPTAPAVGYRSSSTTGDVTIATSRAPAVPAGAAAGDVVVVFVHRWQTFAGSAITGPSGFTHKSTHASGDGLSNVEVWWKRLTGADTGTYTFSWPESMWTGAHAICLTGASAAGDPLDIPNAWAGTAGTFGSTSVTTAYQPGLLWHVYNDAGGSHTPPTGFTEIQDNDCYSSAYRIPGTTGTHTATSGSVSSSSPALAVLVAVQPLGTLPTVTGTAALDLGALSVTAAGTVTAEVVTGSGALDLGAVAVAAVGLRAVPGVALVAFGALSVTTLGQQIEPGSAILALGGATINVSGTVAPPPPGQIFDLDRWHLTLPTGPSSDADQIDQPALDTFTDAHFFSDSARRMTCIAPVDGSTTSGSGGARAELREHEAGSYDNSAWDPLTTGRRQLTITTRADGTSITGGTLPRQEVIIFQIHGTSGTPPIYLTAEWTSSGTPLGTPRVRMFVAGSGMSNANVVTGITPSTDVSIRVRVESAVLKLWAVIGQVEDLPSINTTPTFSAPCADFTDKVDWYFKAGAYNKTDVSSGSTGQAEARISYFELLQPGDSEPANEVSGAVVVSLGALSVAASGTVIAEVVSGTASVALGAPSVAAVGLRTTPGTAQVALPGLDVSAAGTVIAEVVTGSAVAQLGALSVTTVGQRTALGAATLDLGALSLIGLGEGATPPVTGAAAVSLGALSVTAVGTVTAEMVAGTASVALASPIITAFGIRAVIASAAVTLPQLALVAGGIGFPPSQNPPWEAGEPAPTPGPTAGAPTPASELVAATPLVLVDLRAGVPVRS